MTSANDTPVDLPTRAPRALEVEQNGINSISVSEHRGRPRELFWPWFAANISVLGISYGAFLLDFGISFAQAVIVGVVGIVISFLLSGLVSLSGKRGHAPTMTLSRAAFGVNGNRGPSAISWLLLVGWETVLAALAVLATATVFSGMGERFPQRVARRPGGSSHRDRWSSRLRVHHEAADVDHRDHRRADRDL
jgi:purine-cytosine permease-like protein